jgi:hypothetical protein
VATAAGIVAAFLLPVDFYYHYPAFLAPFLAMALVLPAARLLDGWPPTTAWASRAARAARLPRLAVPVAGLVMLVLPVAAGSAEDSRTPTYASALTAIDRVIAPGSCVVTDQVSLLISADRFTSSAAGCPVVVDGTGTSYALGQGRPALTAGTVPAVAAVWRQAFGAARYVLLTRYNTYRIAWTPQLRAYFRENFASVSGPWAPLQLYVRKGT